MKIFFAAWVIWALICLSIGAGVIYAAWHFISKFW